ncbi:MBL fold metallo-hydrolase [Sediminibacillus albus]|uniref:Glyoxylase, beta-lactamase superfamily II n=1 Tax=Sediminibacillus albus TaxID=407036 RepID=A0A1G8X7U7_9BACI|nr:MBL fold metallo-hydrolase [Sediminibacillus albus]SDJ86521.1 Glyoxylase, beta-lactamase superfamily II [Sediminibacillus albus]
MEFQTLKADACYCFHGPVNIGYIRQGERGMLIDAGIDASTMKRVLKMLKQDRLPITHLFITHAHSDHYGGASYLQKQADVHTIAPILETAILQHPILEPLYLFGGNDPLSELRNKFLEGAPVRVDQSIGEGSWEVDGFQFETIHLPGHSYFQLGLLFEGILYAGDSYFGESQLRKHKIPFMTDTKQAIESLEKLQNVKCEGAVPGHGGFEKDFQPTIKANLSYHQQLLDWLEKEITNEPAGITHEAIVARMCAHYQVSAPQLSQWLLFRTAVTAYLTALLRQRKVIGSVDEFRWVFKKNEDVS